MCKHARPHTHKAKIIMMLIMPFIFKCSHIILELSSCTRLNEQSQSKKKRSPSLCVFLSQTHAQTHTHTPLALMHAQQENTVCRPYGTTFVVIHSESILTHCADLSANLPFW